MGTMDVPVADLGNILSGRPDSIEGEGFKHQADEIFQKVDQLEQRVNEIEKFYSTMNTKQPNPSKVSSVVKDKDKERHVPSIKKQQQDATRREAAATKRMQELIRQFGTILRQAAKDLAQEHCTDGNEKNQVQNCNVKVVKSGGKVINGETMEFLLDVRTEGFSGKGSRNSNKTRESFECLVGSVVEQITQNVHKFGMGLQRDCRKINDTAQSSSRFDHLKLRRTDSNIVLRSARVGSVSLNEEAEVDAGRRLFEEVDRDGDGQVTLEDLETEVGKRMLSANEENGNAMRRFDGNVRFEASNAAAVGGPIELVAVRVLRSALAGGISSVLSTSIMYPIDSIKTRVQTSTMSFPKILRMLPQIGARGLYRGSVPALIGQFSSHGVRTGMFEATKVMLINLAPSISDLQVQSLASFCSTFLGTTVRIPGEVLKQRLQAGMFENVGEAIAGTWKQDRVKGFFRGTGATLCREIPFYVTGMGLYNESKKAVRKKLGRELEAWETIAIGALTGGLSAVLTTPFDVVKTRMMTAPQGRSMSMSSVAVLVLTQEGLLGFFKGAVPRFFWIAPLGAMNFAGYELIRMAMEKNRG